MSTLFEALLCVPVLALWLGPAAVAAIAAIASGLAAGRQALAVRVAARRPSLTELRVARARRA